MYLAQWPCLRWILILHNGYAKEDCGLGEGTSPNRRKGIIHSTWELVSLGDGWHKAVKKQRKQNTIFITSCFMAPTYCSHILYLLTPVCFEKACPYDSYSSCHSAWGGLLAGQVLRVLQLLLINEYLACVHLYEVIPWQQCTVTLLWPVRVTVNQIW